MDSGGLLAMSLGMSFDLNNAALGGDKSKMGAKTPSQENVGFSRIGGFGMNPMKLGGSGTPNIASAFGGGLMNPILSDNKTKAIDHFENPNTEITLN